MGQTLAEKILATHADRDEVRPGEFITAPVDLVLANDITGPPTIAQFRGMGATRVFDPDRVALVPDHFTPPKDVHAAALITALRAFAREQHITHYWEMGEVGIEHTLFPEEGLVRPWMIIVGGDSHTCTYGAFGAFGSGLGSTDVAAVLARGTWFRVPATIRIQLRGLPAEFVTGKDIILEVIRRIGVAGANFRVLEFGGDVTALNVDERMAVANMAVEAGAETGLFPADEILLRWLAAHEQARAEGTGPIRPLASDLDAEFEADQELDLAALPPLVAVPFSPGNVQPVAAVRSGRVDQIYLGNCANGTLTDLRQAASVLRGRRLARGMRMIVVPADVILPGRYGTAFDAAALGPHCLEGLDPAFVRKVRPGDVLVVGENFGVRLFARTRAPGDPGRRDRLRRGVVVCADLLLSRVRDSLMKSGRVRHDFIDSGAQH